MEEGLKKIEERVAELSKALVDQEKARVIVEPGERRKGFWFGGGKVSVGGEGRIVLSGRYRDSGDSRYGISAGERGRELSVFVSEDAGLTFEKVKSWEKKDLACGGKKVISIEGSALSFGDDGVRMFVSTEKDISYPPNFEQYRKPGTGVWEIDVFEGDSVENLDASGIRNILSSGSPGNLHVKDPEVFRLDGREYLLYCQHPFSWSSSYTGLARIKESGEAAEIGSDDVLPRGYAWDAAVSRITCRVSVPRAGIFADLPPVSMYFYDGAECVREHSQSERGQKRPRGYSCEELGGLAWGFDEEFPKIFRASRYFPLFVSPDGTGSSRYVSACREEGGLIAVWQKSMSDFSQPLVFNRISKEEAEEILR